MEERPYSSRLKKVGELLDQAVVSREEVVSELGGWTPADRGAERAAGTARTALWRAPGWAKNMVPAAPEKATDSQFVHQCGYGSKFAWYLYPGHCVESFTVTHLSTALGESKNQSPAQD